MIALSKNVHFCRFLDVGVFLCPILTKNLPLYLQNAHWIPELVIADFFRIILCKEVANKLYKKFHSNLKNLKIQGVSHILGNSEELFFHKKGNFLFEKRAADISIPSGAFRCFYPTKISYS